MLLWKDGFVDYSVMKDVIEKIVLLRRFSLIVITD